MKAGKSIELLQKYDKDFEVELSTRDEYLDEVTRSKDPNYPQWPSWRRITVSGIADVGHSSKVVILDGGDHELMFDKENAITAEKLKNGQTCLVQGIGNSMTPILKSKQVCEVIPVTDETELEKSDIVFVKVNGYFYLHKISAIRGGQYQISNNHGHVNGWVSRKNVFGKVNKIL